MVNGLLSSEKEKEEKELHNHSDKKSRKSLIRKSKITEEEGEEIQSENEEKDKFHEIKDIVDIWILHKNTNEESLQKCRKFGIDPSWLTSPSPSESIDTVKDSISSHHERTITLEKSDIEKKKLDLDLQMFDNSNDLNAVPS